MRIPHFLYIFYLITICARKFVEIAVKSKFKSKIEPNLNQINKIRVGGLFLAGATFVFFFIGPSAGKISQGNVTIDLFLNK